MPIPSPPVGGSPCSIAARKSSSMRIASSSPPACAPRLRQERLALVDRVVELGEGVGQLAAGDEELEALDEIGLAREALGQRARPPSGSR